MITVDAINIAPVKSLGLAHPAKVRVESGGVTEDRRFLLADAQATVLTQRQVGPMVQVKANYTVDPELLRLRFPDGKAIEGLVETGDRRQGQYQIIRSSRTRSNRNRRLGNRIVRLLRAAGATDTFRPAGPVLR